METNCDVKTNSDRNTTTHYGYGCKVDRLLDFAGQAAKWRAERPDMITVDRAHWDHPMPPQDDGPLGTAEGYLTPEGGYSYKTNPMVPWETCLTMGQSWA
jgi:hypothetical protein